LFKRQWYYHFNKTSQSLYSFDPATGILECESGVTLKDILDLVVSRDGSCLFCLVHNSYRGWRNRNDITEKTIIQLDICNHVLSFDYCEAVANALTVLVKKITNYFTQPLAD